MMMANVLISEVLCFISNNFEKQPASQLKPVIVSFYNEDKLVETSDAKYLSTKVLKYVLKYYLCTYLLVLK